MGLFDFIQSVENTHRKHLAIEKEEKELLTPVIRDYSRMDELYAVFTDEISKRTNIKTTSIDGRRIFIFIIIRLCCPAVFAGSKLKRGIRDRMAGVLNCDASTISHDFRNLTFHYKRYKGFRHTVDMVYDAMMETLMEK